MSSVSISRAWTEATEAVKANAQLLLPLAFVLVAMPGTILQAMIPTGPGGTPQPSMLVGLLFLPAMLISMIGTLAIVSLVARRDISGHEALSAGARRVLPMIAALLLLVVAMVVITIPVVAIGVLVGGVPTAGSGEMGGGLTLAVLLLSVIFLLGWARFLVLTAVAALEPLGPIALIRRSWALTRGYLGKLIGLVLLFVLVVVVLSIAIQAVVGSVIILVAGPPETGSLSNFLILLVAAAVNTVVTLYFTATITRLYLQLVGEPTTGI